MIIDDIVILRFYLPYRFWARLVGYGCSYNFADIDVKITRVMIRYTEDKKQLCDWCDSCYARRRLDGADGAGDDQQQALLTTITKGQGDDQSTTTQLIIIPQCLLQLPVVLPDEWQQFV
jgi:hypothetical protein